MLERKAIENAIALEGGARGRRDAEAIRRQTNTLAQASMIGEATSRSRKASRAPAGRGKKEDVVDAEFTEVDDDEIRLIWPGLRGPSRQRLNA